MGSEWELYPIGDYVSLSQGLAINSKTKHLLEDKGLPLLRITDLINNTQVQFVNEENAPVKCIARENEVIFTRTGQVGLVFKNKIGVVHNNCFKVIPNAELNNNFLYWFLYQKSTKAYVNSVASGSVQKDLNHAAFLTLQIPVPTLTEQKAIAHILGSLDDKIELNRQMNETLESMAQTSFKSWFVDFDPVIDNALAADNPIPDVFAERVELRRELNANSEKTPSLPNNETASSLKSGGVSFSSYKKLPSTSSGRTRANEGERKPAGGGEDVRTVHPELVEGFPSEFEFTEEMGWIPKGWNNLKLNELLEVKYGKDHKKLEEGSIPVYGSGGLMRLVNKSLYIGESILIPRKGTLSNLMFVDEEFWTVDTMFFSIPKLNNSAKYLYYQLKKLDFLSMNVGSAVPSMTTKVLNDLNILKPDEGLLKEFDSLVSDIFAKKKSLDQENQTLSRLRDTLLPKLLSGELRIPDAKKLIKEASV